MHFYGTSGEIFSALEQGVDVFDSSPAYSATERGCAVVFPVKSRAHDSSSSHQVSGGPERGGGGEEEGKRGSGGEVLPFEIDLNEER